MCIYIRNRSGNEVTEIKKLVMMDTMMYVTYKNRNEVVQPLDKSKQGEDAVHCLVGTEKTDESEMLQKWKTGLKSPWDHYWFRTNQKPKKTDTKDDQRNNAKQNGMYHRKKCKRGQLSLPPILIFSHILTTTKAESVSIVAGVLVRSHLFSRHTRLAQYFFCVRQFLPALEVVGPRIGPLAIGIER